PSGGKFIRLREPEYSLLQHLDGKSSPSEAAEHFVRNFHRTISPQDILGFVEQLGKLGFIEGSEVERSQRRSLFFIKLRAFNPERLLDRLYPRLKWLYSQPALLLQILVLLVGALVFFGNLASFPFNLARLLTASNVVVAIVSIFLLITMHEFAHALTCKRYGGGVREMGFLLLYFQPCFYCNLSDAYLFENRRERLGVNFAGVWFQAVIWAGFAILWRLTNEGYFLNQVFYLTAAVSVATLLFNLNPAIKLDGYYLLADYLEIPNLRQKAFAYLWDRLRVRWFGCESQLVIGPSAREAKVYHRYGLTAMLYSAALIGFILFRGAQLLIAAWQGAGFILFLVLALLIFRRSAARSSRALLEIWRERKAVWMRPRRIIVYTAIVGAIIILSLVVPVTRTTGGAARLLSAESYVVRQFGPGLLEGTYFRGGKVEKKQSQLVQLSSADQSVTRMIPLLTVGDTALAGDTLLLISSTLNAGLLEEAISELRRCEADRRLLLSDPKLEQIATKRAEAKQAEAAYEAARLEYNRAKELHDREMIPDDQLESKSASFNMTYSAWQAKKSELDLLMSGPKAEEVESIDAEIAKLQARRDYLQAQAEATTITSPIAGRLIAPQTEGEIFHLARLESLMVEIDFPESDLDIISPNSAVDIRVAAYPGRTYRGEVSRLKIASQPQAVAFVENSDHHLLPGMSGYAKIECGKVSIAELAIRKIARFFRLEVWSWF
ncbi:MAG: hypothetical protein ABIJ61_02085, partial [bacterium]